MRSSRCSTRRMRPGTRRAGTTPRSTSSSTQRADRRPTRPSAPRSMRRRKSLMNERGALGDPGVLRPPGGAAQLCRGLCAASARLGVPARLGLARQRRPEARLRAADLSGVAGLVAATAAADRLHAVSSSACWCSPSRRSLPADAAVRPCSARTPRRRRSRRVRVRLGLNDPVWLQYRPLGRARCCRGDFGISMRTGQPVGAGDVDRAVALAAARGVRDCRRCSSSRCRSASLPRCGGAGPPISAPACSPISASRCRSSSRPRSLAARLRRQAAVAAARPATCRSPEDVGAGLRSSRRCPC